jgi:hypothetical protein
MNRWYSQSRRDLSTCLIVEGAQAKRTRFFDSEMVALQDSNLRKSAPSDMEMEF